MFFVRLHTSEVIEVDSLKAASNALLYSIAKSGVGASEFYSTEGVGQVVQKDNDKLVAVISYNGRIWQPTTAGRAGQVEIRVK